MSRKKQSQVLGGEDTRELLLVFYFVVLFLSRLISKKVP